MNRRSFLRGLAAVATTAAMSIGYLGRRKPSVNPEPDRLTFENWVASLDRSTQREILGGSIDGPEVILPLYRLPNGRLAVGPRLES